MIWRHFLVGAILWFNGMYGCDIGTVQYWQQISNTGKFAKMVHPDWLTVMAIDIVNLPLITSSSMNPLVQASNHSPQNSDRDVHAIRTYGNPHQTRKWVTSLLLLVLKTRQQPLRPHKTKKQKNIKPSSLDR